ncbi:hypothetical protein FHR53_003926 [Xanthomonas arboricola]
MLYKWVRFVALFNHFEVRAFKSTLSSLSLIRPST